MSEKNGNGKHVASDPRIRPDAHEREVLNIEEAAELLGVSIKTFNKVLHSETLPARKIGREWKFSRKALVDWVGSGRSIDFYRDANEDEEEAEPVARHETATKEEARPRTRRTAGWQIEMD
jgi:excisionase family DNA binding protein